MPHFPVNSNNIKEDILKIVCPETVHHLVNALRIKKGEIIKFIDERKIQYKAEIIDFSKKEVAAKILESETSKRELSYNIFLAQSILKQDGENLLISNAAQLGIKGVYPFISEYSTIKKDIAEFKGEKWQRISDEAFKQCERADRMPVFEISPLPEILKKFKKVLAFYVLWCYTIDGSRDPCKIPLLHCETSIEDGRLILLNYGK